MVSNPSTKVKTEAINGVILRLLGLKPGVEIDYQTYYKKILNRLAIDGGIVSGVKKLPAEESNLLRQELKRIKRIKDKGIRIKIKEAKVRVASANVGPNRPPSGPNRPPSGPGGPSGPNSPKSKAIVKSKTAKITPKSDILGRSTAAKQDSKDSDVKTDDKPSPKFSKNILIKIDETLSSILETLVSLNKLQDNRFQRDRRERENRRREEKESGLEKGRKLVTGAVKKIIAPFQSIFDKIFNFIFFTLLGRAFTMLMNWLGDPKNKKKVQTLGRFLKDWWPALLAGVALFMTPFGGFVKGVVTIVSVFSRKIVKLIPTLVGAVKGLGGGAARLGRFAAANPVATAVTVGAVAAGAGAYAASQQNEAKRKDVDPNAVTPGQGKTPGASQLMREQILQRGIGGFSRGAKIEGGYNGIDKNTGIPITGAGKDTQIIAARPGEIVLTPEDRTDIYNKTGYDIADQVKNRKPNFIDSSKIKLFGNTPLMSLGGILGFSNGGMIGDIPLYTTFGKNPDENTLRRAARSVYGSNPDPKFSRIKIPEDDIVSLFKKLGGVPNLEKVTGLSIREEKTGIIRDEIKNTLKGLVEQNKSGSFTQSSRAAAGLDDLANKFDMDAKTAPRYAENLPKLNKPKPKPNIPRVGPNRMLPAAGQSSANAMRAAAKTARVSRPPIPKTSAIVPYTGGGLARTGVTGGLSVPQIRTNMKVPGGFGNLKSFGAELLLNYLVQSGLSYVEAKRLTSTIEKARKESPEKLAERIEKLRELVDKEERYQKSFRGILDKVIKLGGETGSEVLSRQAKTVLAGLGANPYQGGAVKGGFGLKKEDPKDEFKNAPKTQIMTDDKGRPFVGYKAKRGGRLVYVRGPKPGEGTSNPLESIGRMINPNAYKANDERLEREKFKEALANSLQSLQARGASVETQKKMMKQMGSNLEDVQNDLNARNKAQPKPKSYVSKPYTQPKPKPYVSKPYAQPKPKPYVSKPYVPAGGGMGGRRGGVKKRQGGGDIEGGVSPAEIQRAYNNARKNKTLSPLLLLELGREAHAAARGPAATGGGWGWRSPTSSGATDYYGNPLPLPKKKFGGGFMDISSNFGIDTSMFGADTQFSPPHNTAFQLGEGLFDFDYVLTKNAMMNGAREQLAAYAERLNANDPGSNARKQGIVPAKVNQPNITPYTPESVASMITMPPIRQSSGGMRTPASPTGPAAFSATPSGDQSAQEQRMLAMQMFGIVG